MKLAHLMAAVRTLVLAPRFTLRPQPLIASSRRSSKRTLGAACGLACLLGLLAAGTEAAPVKEQILVKARPQASKAAVDQAIAAEGAQAVDAIPQIAVRILRVPEARRARVLAALQRNPNFEFAEADALVAPGSVPNDPYYSYQWHLPKIAAPEAWDVTTGSDSVIVAIADTGVDGSHPDLAPLMVPGWNFYDNNSDTRDVYGHGTSVAGSAVAVGNNALGIASVAWQCRIMPLRVSDPNGYASYSTMAKAITWAADRGARVANVSFAGAGRSSTVQSAAQYLQGKGGVTTASGGNDGTFLNVADSPYVLSVSATDSADRLASFSNTGPYIDLAAPGSGIYTTARGGGYRSASGTSFSAPIVAGAAALIISLNPALTALEVQDLLTHNADDLGAAGYDTGFGHGRLNVARAVQAAALTSAPEPAAPPAVPPADTTPPTVAFAAPTQSSTVTGTVLIQVNAADETALDRIELYSGGELVAVGDTGQLNLTWDTTGEAEGACTLTAVAYDLAANQSTATCTVTVRNSPDTTAPTVVITSPKSGTKLATSQKVNVTAKDDSGVVRVELYANRTLIASTAGNSTGSYTFSWNTAKLARGTYTLEAVAYDAAGNAGISPGVSVTK